MAGAMPRIAASALGTFLLFVLAVDGFASPGAPGIFTAGNDIEDFVSAPPRDLEAPVFQFMRAMVACQKPVVAAVCGPAVGIGATLLLHCDLVYIADNTRLMMPFVALGIVPEFASSFLLPKLIGHVRANEYLLLGNQMASQQAVEFGIANAALPAAEALEHARVQALKLASLPPLAILASKRLLRQQDAGMVMQAIEAEGAALIECFQTPEAQSAFERFLRPSKPCETTLK
jgi:enoyl-CoA hydratase/carnithine racemase